MSKRIMVRMELTDEQYRELIRLAAQRREARKADWEATFQTPYTNSVDDPIQVAIKELVLAAIEVQP